MIELRKTAKMNKYIVHCVCELPMAYNEWFLTRGNTKKDALDKVYKEYGEEFYKKDFVVYTLDEMFDSELGIDDVVLIH